MPPTWWSVVRTFRDSAKCFIGLPGSPAGYCWGWRCAIQSVWYGLRARSDRECAAAAGHVSVPGNAGIGAAVFAWARSPCPPPGGASRCRMVARIPATCWLPGGSSGDGDSTNTRKLTKHQGWSTQHVDEAFDDLLLRRRAQRRSARSESDRVAAAAAARPAGGGIWRTADAGGRHGHCWPTSRNWP